MKKYPPRAEVNWARIWLRPAPAVSVSTGMRGADERPFEASRPRKIFTFFKEMCQQLYELVDQMVPKELILNGGDFGFMALCFIGKTTRNHTLEIRS